jgi:hypothetical protein
MNRNTALFLAVSFLLVNGCVTQSRTSTLVALTITSDTASDNFVKQVRDATLHEIAAEVPNARPMTVNVKLDVSAQIKSTPSINASQPVNQQRPISTMTPDPVREYPQATVPVNNSPFQSTKSQQITGYRVAYSISDATGRVVESNELTLDGGHLVDAASHTAITPQNGLIGDTADFLAARVKTLNR